MSAPTNNVEGLTMHEGLNVRCYTIASNTGVATLTVA